MKNQSKTIRQFGLLGRKLSHSFSKKYFDQKFSNESITDSEFLNFEIAGIHELHNLIHKHPMLGGFFVTIPYKETIIGLLDEIDEIATEIKAVNLVKCIRGNSSIHLKGYNTDATGFEQSLQKFLTGGESNAMVLGTGGASKAVHYILKKMGLNVINVSRSKSNDSDLIRYNQITGPLLNSMDIIVNTTPLGMYPEINSCPDLPYDMLKKDVIAFDLIYNPEMTLFMQKTLQFGAVVTNGYEMLIKQAEKGWEILTRD